MTSNEVTLEKDISDSPGQIVESQKILNSPTSSAANDSSTALDGIRYDSESNIAADMTSHGMTERGQAQENPLGATNQTVTQHNLPAMPPIQGDVGMEVDSAVSINSCLE